MTQDFHESHATLCLQGYPYWTIRDESSTQLFRDQIRDDQDLLVKKLIEVLRSAREAGACDAHHEICWITEGKGTLRYEIRGHQVERRAFERIGSGLKRFTLRLGGRVAPEAEAARLRLGRRIHRVEIATERRARTAGPARELPPGAPIPGFLPVRLPFVAPMRLQLDRTHGLHLATHLASLRSPASLRFSLRLLERSDVEQPGLDHAVKLWTEGLSSLLSLEAREEQLAPFRNLLTAPELLWIVCEVRGEAPDEIRSALGDDTDPAGWMCLPDTAFSPREFAGQLPFLWTPADAAALIAPPRSLGDALPGLVPVRILPFDLPPARECSASEVTLGTLVDGGGTVSSPIDTFKRGTAIVGVPRCGKSNTAGNIICQLRKARVLVVDPVGSGWDKPILEIGGRVFGFGAGLEPWGFHGFRPAAAGVRVREQAQLLAHALSLAYPTTEFGVQALEVLLSDLYVLKHLDVAGKVVRADVEVLTGRDFDDPALLATLPTMADLQRHGPWLIEGFARGYDFEEWYCLTGALKKGHKVAIAPLTQQSAEILPSMKRRIAKLRGSALERLLTAPAEDPYRRFEPLLEQNALLQLSTMASAKEKAAVVAVLLGMLCAVRVNGPEYADLRHLLVLEEAHGIAPAHARQGSRELASDAEDEMASLVCRIITELPKYGQGLMWISPAPSAVRAECFSSVSTVLCHRLLAGAERERVADALGLHAGQAEALSSLEIGEQIAYVNRNVCRIQAPEVA